MNISVVDDAHVDFICFIGHSLFDKLIRLFIDMSRLIILLAKDAEGRLGSKNKFFDTNVVKFITNWLMVRPKSEYAACGVFCGRKFLITAPK